MTDLRAARERVIRAWYRRLCDSLTEALPGLLDALDAVDRAHEAARPVRVASYLATREEIAAYVAQEGGPANATDEQIEQWSKDHPPLIDRVLASLPPVDDLLAGIAAGEVPHPDAPSLAAQVASARTAAPRPAARRKPRGGTTT